MSCETAEAAGSDYAAAERALLDALHNQANLDLPEVLRPPPWPEAPPLQGLQRALQAWSLACPRPVVLLLDEVDALRGQSLTSVLRQLRAGYTQSRGSFPWSVVLCGLRDVRDYKVASGGDPERLGTASPFNIKVKSVRLGDFSPEEVSALYGQHSEETGQAFTPEAIDRAVELSGGQPWLVNALAREVIDEMGVEAPEAITAGHLDEAKERLILARATHLDSLVARLREPRVRRLIGPLIAGDLPPAEHDAYNDDTLYLSDLGLVAPTSPLRVANPIYREVIVRVLAQPIETVVVTEPRSFVDPDGSLNLDRILTEFAEFRREHGAILASKMSYHEVAPQLVLMAYLQRVVNGGAFIDRGYGVGRGRIDLLVRWPLPGSEGLRAWQREAIELKVWREKKPDPLARGLSQLDAYLDGLGLDHGTLVLFDRRPEAAPIEERTEISETTSPRGRPIRLLRARP